MKKLLFIAIALPLLACCTTEDEDVRIQTRSENADSVGEAGVTIEVDTAWSGVDNFEI